VSAAVDPLAERHGAMRLAEVLRDEGGALAAALAGSEADAGKGPAAPGPAQMAAAGPRAAGHRAETEVAVEAVLEGYRLHYAHGLVVRHAEADLALLGGDGLYALGLERLAALGDLEAIAELADVIALCALAHAAREEGGGDGRLARAAWDAGGAAVGWGSTPAHVAAKEAARAGAPDAPAALDAAVRHLTSDVAPRR